MGASLVGGLFTSRLSSLLSERMPAQAAASVGDHGTSSLTPELVSRIPEPIHGIIVNAYNDALNPAFPLPGTAWTNLCASASLHP